MFLKNFLQNFFLSIGADCTFFLCLTKKCHKKQFILLELCLVIFGRCLVIIIEVFVAVIGTINKNIDLLLFSHYKLCDSVLHLLKHQNDSINFYYPFFPPNQLFFYLYWMSFIYKYILLTNNRIHVQIYVTRVPVDVRRWNNHHHLTVTMTSNHPPPRQSMKMRQQQGIIRR